MVRIATAPAREPATLRLGPQVALVGHPEFSHMEAEDLMNYERF